MESEIRRPIAKDARRCAFTGYRPMKMPFGYDEECQLALDFKHRLHDTIEMLILQGYRHMISGGAQGMDTKHFLFLRLRADMALLHF